VADSCITVAGGLLVVDFFIQMKQKKVQLKSSQEDTSLNATDTNSNQ